VCAETKKVALGLRVEWAKSRARARRWTEEIGLLEEETRRVLKYLDWQAGWWEDRGTAMAGCRCLPGGGVMTRAQSEGYLAFAHRQAAIRHDLRGHFSHKWRYLGGWLDGSIKYDLDTGIAE
jgi:hypothetical protein